MTLNRIVLGGKILRPVALGRSAQPLISLRSLHGTVICYRKRQSSSNEEDAFEAEEEDLFASPAEPETTTRLDLASSAPGSQAAKLVAKRAIYFQKSKEKFMEHPVYAALVGLQARNPGRDINVVINSENKNINPSKWTHAPGRAKLAKLIAWAGTRAELLEIVDILKIYRAKCWPVDDLNRIDFIGRCRTLRAPDIALAVLYHRPKFGIDIPSLTAARALMQSLLATPCPAPGAEESPIPDDIALPTSTPFSHALLLANLFDLYALPPVETDQVARALLLGGSVQQFNAGGDIEDARIIVQKVRERAETQKASSDKEGVVLDERDPRVKGGKLVATSSALKMRGKVVPDVAKSKGTSFYGDELTNAERTWVERRLEIFIQWAQKEGQDVSWVDRLRVAT